MHAQKQLIHLIIERSLIKDINCLNGTGHSALHLAAALGTFDMVNALLSKGADINLEGHSKIRAIHLAAINNGLGVLNLLLSHDCLILPDTAGFTPEMLALKHGQKVNADRLRSHEQGKSYHFAAFLNHFYSRSFDLHSM